MPPRRSTQIALILLLGLFTALPAFAAVGTLMGPDGEPRQGTIRVLETPDDPGATPRVIRSGPDGRFDLGPLPGEAWVRLEAAGLRPVVLKGPAVVDPLDVRLETGSTLRGRVVDRWTGQAIPDASVWVCDGEATRFGFNACAEHRAAADGTFAVPGVPDAAVRLGAASPNHAFSAIDLPARRAPDDFYLLQPEEGAPIRGRLLDDRERPVVGARIGQDDYTVPFTNRTEIVFDPPLITDENGEFVHPGVGLRSRKVYRGLSDGWYGIPSGWVSPVQGTSQQLELRVARPSSLQFGLRDEGRPVQPAVMLVHKTLSTVSWRETEASPDGRYHLENLPVEPLELRLNVKGYQPVPLGEVDLGPGKTIDLGDLDLVLGVTLSATVVGADGAAADGGWIEIGYQEPVKFRYRASTADGFRLDGLPPGVEILVRAGAPGYDGFEDTWTLRQDTRQEIVLDPLGSVSGRVLQSAGEPMTGFTVRAVLEGSTSRTHPQKEVESPDGRFMVWPIRDAGIYSVEIAANGYRVLSVADVPIGEREAVDLGELRLELGHTVAGTAAQPDGSPAAGARVWIAPRAREGNRGGSWGYTVRPEGFVAQTGGDGRYAISGLEPGFFVMNGLHPDYAPWSQDLQLYEDVTEETVDLTFSAGGTVHGTTRDENGAPVGAIKISAECSGLSEERTTETDAQGYYRIQRLPDGQCLVKAFTRLGGQPFGNSKLVSIVQDRESQVDFDLSRSIEVSGTVRLGGKPSERAFLTFNRASNFVGGGPSVSTDGSTGRYRIRLSEPGEYRVWVQASPAQKVFRVVVGDVGSMERDFDIPANWVLGRVVDRDGRPLSDVVVTGSNADLDPLTTSGLFKTTDREGRFELRNLDPGSYTIAAAHEGYRPTRSNPVPVGAETRIDDLELVLEESTAQIRGRVVDPGGSPATEGFVVAAPAGMLRIELGTHARLRSDGSFVLDVPDEQPVDLTVLTPGWAPARVSGVQPSGDELIVQAGFGGEIRVTVTDQNGGAAEGLLLDIRAEPGWLASDSLFAFNPLAVTGPDGVAVGRRIPQGTYRVTVPGGSSGMVQVVEGATVELQLQSN